MTDARALRAEALKSLQARIDKRYLEQIRRLVPGEALILGVRVPEIRALVKPFHDHHRELDLELVSALVDEQFSSHCREEMLFGVLLLVRFKRKFSCDLWPRIDGWVDAIDNWETCDQLAMGVACPVLAKDLSLLKDVRGWVKSRNRWRRRFALATVAALNQKGRSHAGETLEICDGALKEEEPIVQKAVEWALREACKSDERAVFDFLSSRKDRIHPKILRGALPKLAPAHQTALKAGP